MWKTWYSRTIKLKRSVATAVQNYYAMYVGYSFRRWWLRTRINFSIKHSCTRDGRTVTFIERRDDFTVVNAFTRDNERQVKGDLKYRYFVDMI